MNQNIISPKVISEAIAEVAKAKKLTNQYENKVSKSLIAIRKTLRQKTQVKWGYSEMAVRFRVSLLTYKGWEENGLIANASAFVARYQELHAEI